MPAGRPRKFDSDDLLDKAVELIWREGPMALSLNEIATRLNTTKPALARRFGGKDAFLAAVLARYHDMIDALVEQALAQAHTVEEVARAFLDSYVSALSEKPVGPTTGCLLAATTEACANQTETELARTIATLNDHTRASLIEALRRAGAEDAEVLAEYLYGQSVALAFLSRTQVGGQALSAFADRAMAGIQREVAPQV